MIEEQSPGRIPIDSITVLDRIRKDFGDIDSLAESIVSVGLMQPIVINEKNELVDGQRRIKAYLQLRRTQIPFFQVNLKEIMLGEFHANSNRKDFTSSERVAISNAIEKYVYENSRGVGRPRAKKNKGKVTILNNECALDSRNNESNSVNNERNNTKNNLVKLTTFSGRLKDNVARYFGMSRNTLEKEKKIIKAAEQDPEAFSELRNKVDQRKISLDKALNEIQKQIKKAQILSSIRNSSNNSSTTLNNITLLHGDFREQSRTISNRTIDLIFTDPPYAAEYLPLYNDLGVVATNVLKNGASLVTYVGQYAIPEVIEIMRRTGLTYWWTIAIILSGSFAKYYPRHVSIKWKPLLWFVKGDKLSTTDFLSDVIISDTPSKALHEWEQSPIEAEHVISRLTVEGQTVFDPMMGSNTTGLAAIKLNRKFIGIELDEEKFQIAEARLTNVSDIKKGEAIHSETKANTSGD